MKHLRPFTCFLFFMAVFGFTFRTWGLQSPIPTLEPVLALVHNKIIAFEFPKDKHSILAHHLPSKGPITVIFDNPYLPLSGQEALLFQTQNTFIPLILNPYSGEDVALVICSSDAIANKRLAEMRYQWIQKISPGKGIARFSA